MNKINIFKTTSLLFSLFLFSFSNAQKFTTDLSATYLNGPYENLYRLGDNVITFSETENRRQMAYTAKLNKIKFGIKLMKYDAAMNLVKENQLFNGERICGPFSSSIQKINDKLWLIYTDYEEGSKENIKIMAACIDTATLNIAGPKLLLRFDQQNVGIFKMMNLLTTYKFIVKQSPDESKVVAAWSSNLNNEFFVAVLNESLDILWNRKEKVPVNRIILNSVCVDNSGNAYAGYNYNLGGNENAGRVSVYKQKGSPTNIEVKIVSGHPYDVLVLPSQKKDFVYITGTYAGIPNCLTGVYKQTVSTTNFKADRIQLKDFPPEFIEQLDKDSWASTKSKKYGLEPFPSNAYELEDGSIGLVGQFSKFEAITERSFSSNTWTTKQRNYSITGSIIDIRLKDDKVNFSWIPRYRTSTVNSIGASYFAFPYKNKLLIFYNDEANNLKKEIGEKYSNSNNYKNVVLVVASMGDDGRLKRENLIDLASENYLPLGESVIPLSSSSLWVPVVKIKTLGGVGPERRWGTIKIE